ncbi:hypothetical protein DID75_02540 [Candidatus Marinamargulisbacteria bacterium SCGC AG-410-N11]|nr:hypothetical protein DID75_02540 [Candidatus Marinamargulisbacteria bacterium SCGC AG-410-N11]
MTAVLAVDIEFESKFNGAKVKPYNHYFGYPLDNPKFGFSTTYLSDKSYVLLSYNLPKKWDSYANVGMYFDFKENAWAQGFQVVRGLFTNHSLDFAIKSRLGAFHFNFNNGKDGYAILSNTLVSKTFNEWLTYGGVRFPIIRSNGNEMTFLNKNAVIYAGLERVISKDLSGVLFIEDQFVGLGVNINVFDIRKVVVGVAYHMDGNYVSILLKDPFKKL